MKIFTLEYTDTCINVKVFDIATRTEKTFPDEREIAIYESIKHQLLTLDDKYPMPITALPQTIRPEPE